MTHDSRSKALVAELEYYGYKILDGNVVSIEGTTSDPHSVFIARLNSLEEDQIGKLKLAWKMVESNIKILSGGITVHGLRVLQKSIIRLLRKTNQAVLRDTAIAKHVKSVAQTAADRMSQSTAEQSAVILSVIELHEYNIKKIVYIKYLIKLCLRLNASPQNSIVVKASIQGPYSNLDLPMEERVFTWAAIDDEVVGRTALKQNQRRYKLGLEDNAPSDSKVGFYWRELRNEPYLFSSGTAEAGEGQTYPYRMNIWGNS